jgi:hypothetical protein
MVTVASRSARGKRYQGFPATGIKDGAPLPATA